VCGRWQGWPLPALLYSPLGLLLNKIFCFRHDFPALLRFFYFLFLCPAGPRGRPAPAAAGPGGTAGVVGSAWTALCMMIVVMNYMCSKVSLQPIWRRASAHERVCKVWMGPQNAESKIEPIMAMGLAWDRKQGSGACIGPPSKHSVHCIRNRKFQSFKYENCCIQGHPSWRGPPVGAEAGSVRSDNAPTLVRAFCA
jgi:hypothetical protein